MTNFKAIFSPKKLHIINNKKYFIGIDVAVRHDVSRCKYSHSEVGSRLYPIANQGVHALAMALC